MRYFTGIDVSLRSVSICVVDEAGDVRHEAKVAAEVDVIVATLKRFSAEIRQVGFEAGTPTQYLTYGPSAARYEVVCMEARQVAASLAAMRNKTDRNDARGLVQIPRTGWFRTVHVKSVESHQVRALLASRKMVLTKCIDIENEVRGLLKVFGVRLPARVGHGGFDDLRPWVVALPDVAKCLLPLLDARSMLYRTYLQLDTAVRGLARQDPVCQRLMTVPGVGPVTSLTFKAVVDEPRRFRSSRNVAANFGLTPRRYQSGKTDNPGRISKAGDPGVRLALYGAAHALMTRSDAWSVLNAWGLRLAKVRGHRRAVIAVAHKLAVILHRMWIDGTDFRAARPEVAA